MGPSQPLDMQFQSSLRSWYRFIVEYQCQTAYFHFWFLVLVKPEPVYCLLYIELKSRISTFNGKLNQNFKIKKYVPTSTVQFDIFIFLTFIQKQCNSFKKNSISMQLLLVDSISVTKDEKVKRLNSGTGLFYLCYSALKGVNFYKYFWDFEFRKYHIGLLQKI